MNEYANQYRLPRKFWNDHAERGLPAGNYITESGNIVWITASDDEINEILSDAKFYSDRWGPDCIEPSLKRSAIATVKAIEKQKRQYMRIPANEPV